MLATEDMHLAHTLAHSARQADRLVFTDEHGRVIRLLLTCELRPGGGYWYASTYDAASGKTINVYVGSHFGARKPGGLGPAISAEGLARASNRIAAKIEGQVSRPKCPTCGTPLRL